MGRGVKISILNHIYKEETIELILEQELRKRIKVGEIKSPHPSSIGKCLRQFCYRYLDGEAPPSLSFLKKTEEGSARHEDLISLLASSGRLVSKELKLEKENGVNGRVDAIICLNNEHIVVEFKIRNRSVIKEIKDNNYPLISDVMQLGYYLYRLQNPKGILFYESKDDQTWLWFRVGLDGEQITLQDKDYNNLHCALTISSILDRFKILTKFIEQTKELPERELAKNSKDCKWCNYRKKCWADA